MQMFKGLWRVVATVLFLCLTADVLPAASEDGRLADDLTNYVAEVDKGLAPATTEDCMACHGPLEVWLGVAQDFISSAGVPVNPHITFDTSNPANPHASGEGVMDCVGCHQPHPIPLVSPMPDADVELCVSCHHTGTFRACSECH